MLAILFEVPIEDSSQTPKFTLAHTRLLADSKLWIYRAYIYPLIASLLKLTSFF